MPICMWLRELNTINKESVLRNCCKNMNTEYMHSFSVYGIPNFDVYYLKYYSSSYINFSITVSIA